MRKIGHIKTSDKNYEGSSYHLKETCSKIQEFKN